MKPGKASQMIAALLGVPIGKISRRTRGYGHRVWRVEIRRGKEILVDLEAREIFAERWGLGWSSVDHPDVAKTIRDIYNSGDEPGPENAEGKRRVTMEDYLAWRRAAVYWEDLGTIHRKVSAR